MSSNCKEKPRESVYVNVYDMYTMNSYTSAIGIGIYHCGVEVYGVEYGYGGHPFPFSGIFEMIPKDSEELGETFRFKESIEIGQTDFTKVEIEQIVILLGREYRGIDYHLMNRNCNSFSSQFCKTICGEDIPSWVNRLAYLTTFVPFIERVIPKEWISPIAIQHTVESHMNETNNSMANASNNISNYSSTNSTSLQQHTSASSSSEQQKLVQTTSNSNSKSESLSSQQSVQSVNSNNSIWSTLFNNLEKLEPNK